MRNRYYTPEQLEQLEQRRQALGEDAIKDVEREWARDLRHAARRDGQGHRPRRPEAAGRSASARASCSTMFTGGDPGIEASLKTMYETEGPEKASRGMADPEVFAYLGEGPRGGAVASRPSTSSSQEPRERSGAGSCRRCWPPGTR